MEQYNIGDLLMMHRLSAKPVIGIVKCIKSKAYLVEWLCEDAVITTNVWFAEGDIQYYRQAYKQYEREQIK